jgi:hypothetical protein
MCIDFPLFFRHIRTVSTITDNLARLCEDHFQIAGAKRVPASRGAAQTHLQSAPPSAIFEN